MSALRVECREARGRRVPARFGQPGAMHEVAELVDWWPGRDHQYFRVRTADGARFILRHASAQDTWQIYVFEDARWEPALEVD
jgi:hypothetical protein